MNRYILILTEDNEIRGILSPNNTNHDLDEFVRELLEDMNMKSFKIEYAPISPNLPI